MEMILEPIKEVNVVEEDDIIICGGGPAGVAAAIASARSGAKTRLIEFHGCLGGIWTAGALSWVLDCENKYGIMKEFIEKLEERGSGRVARANNFICDVEDMKLFLEEMCIEAGVKIQLHTQVVGTKINENNRLTHIITESKSGRQAWKAKMFIDCTGDGDLGALAGCGFDLGKADTGEMQPMSLIALISGVDPDEIRIFNNTLPYPKDSSPKKLLLKEIEKSGFHPSYDDPALLHVKDDLYLMMANHEYGYCGLNAQDVTDATLNSRIEVHKIVNALRSLGGAWKNMKVVSTAEQIGVREGRRIHGRYQLTVDDVVSGAKQPDAICRVQFGLDVHSLNRDKSGDYEKHGLKAQPFDIPLRSIIAKDIDGLLMAGRCISGDFLAHSSYRVTGDAVTLGNVAGLVAAQSIKNNREPYDITNDELKDLLKQNNLFKMFE